MRRFFSAIILLSIIFIFGQNNFANADNYESLPGNYYLDKGSIVSIEYNPPYYTLAGWVDYGSPGNRDYGRRRGGGGSTYYTLYYNYDNQTCKVREGADSRGVFDIHYGMQFYYELANAMFRHCYGVNFYR